MKKLFLITLFFAALTSLASAEMKMENTDPSPTPKPEHVMENTNPSPDPVPKQTMKNTNPKKFVSTNAAAIEEKHSPAEAKPEDAKE